MNSIGPSLKKSMRGQQLDLLRSRLLPDDLRTRHRQSVSAFTLKAVLRDIDDRIGARKSFKISAADIAESIQCHSSLVGRVLEILEAIGIVKKRKSFGTSNSYAIDWAKIRDLPVGPKAEKRKSRKNKTSTPGAEVEAETTTPKAEVFKAAENRPSTPGVDHLCPTGSTPLPQGQFLSANERKESAIKPAARFKPPTVKDVATYCAERKNSIDPELFFAHYEANGWRQGKDGGRPIKNWRAAIWTWERKPYNKAAASSSDSALVSADEVVRRKKEIRTAPPKVRRT